MTAALVAVAPSAASGHEDLPDVPHDGASSAAVHALDSRGVFDGTLCGQDQDHFCPQEPLTRAHMAVWLVRLIDGTDPPGVKATRFSDVDGDHPQAAFIERFAALGITAGCSTVPLSYCPDGQVTRAQTATFLAQAYDLEAADPAGFTDVAVGGIHSADIDALFSAGITAGCATEPLRFCPQRATTRAQMASLLVRADDYAAERQAAMESLNSESLSDDGNPVGGGDTPRGNDNPVGGGDTPGGDDNPPGGGDTPGGDDNPPGGGDTPGGDDNPPGGGDTPGGDDNPPPELQPPVVIPGDGDTGGDPDADQAKLSAHQHAADCRATSVPIATERWVKIANFEWAEPNHNPQVDPDADGYWQPDWIPDRGGDSGKVKWAAPYIVKDSRRVAGETEYWRMKEVAYFRITRSPAWSFGSVVIDADTGDPLDSSLSSTHIDSSVLKAADLAPTSTQARVDGIWTYTLSDVSQPSRGAVYTIEASTCEAGPWSRPLELQYKLPNAPRIRAEQTYLTRYGPDGHLLADNGLALNVGWYYERGEFYTFELNILDAEGNYLNYLPAEDFFHRSLPGSSGLARTELRNSVFNIADDDNLAGSGKQIRVRFTVGKDYGLINLAPRSPVTELTFSTNDYLGPRVDD